MSFSLATISTVVTLQVVYYSTIEHFQLFKTHLNQSQYLFNHLITLIDIKIYQEIEFTIKSTIINNQESITEMNSSPKTLQKAHRMNETVVINYFKDIGRIFICSNSNYTSIWITFCRTETVLFSDHIHKKDKKIQEGNCLRIENILLLLCYMNHKQTGLVLHLMGSMFLYLRDWICKRKTN